MVIGEAIENSVEKDMQRAGWVGLFRLHGPKDGYVLILGGLFTDKRGNLIVGSEPYMWLQAGVDPKRIVSIEGWNKGVHEQNCKNRAGIKCIWSDLKEGGLAKVVEDFVSKKKTVALVNADFMGTHTREHSSISRIMRALAHQKQNALLFVNLCALKRCGADKGKFNVIDSLKEHDDFRLELRTDEYNRAKWDFIFLTINGEASRTFEYVSDHAPMQSFFLAKTRNHDFKMEREISVEVKKDPKMVAAGHKAADTRRMNQMKRYPEKRGRKEIYGLEVCKQVAKFLIKGQSLTDVCAKLDLPYMSIWQALKRHGYATKH